MSLDTPQPPRDEMEARLTALLLGELSADEAATLQRAIEQDAELARLHERLKQTVRLVREAAVSPTEPANAQTTPLKLSPERRQKLLAQFKTVAPKEFTPPRQRKVSWFVPVSAAAALVVLAGLALLWTSGEHRIGSLPALRVIPSLLVETALSGEGEMRFAKQGDAYDDFSYRTENERQKALGVHDRNGDKAESPAKPASERKYNIVLPSDGLAAEGALVAKNGSWDFDERGASQGAGSAGIGGSENAAGRFAGGSQRAWFGGSASGGGGARGGAEPNRLDFDGVPDMAGPAKDQQSLQDLDGDSPATPPPPPPPIYLNEPATGFSFSTEAKKERTGLSDASQTARFRQIDDKKELGPRASAKLADIGFQSDFGRPAELPQLALAPKSSEGREPASGGTDKKAGPADVLALMAVPTDLPAQTSKPLEPAPMAELQQKTVGAGVASTPHNSRPSPLDQSLHLKRPEAIEQLARIRDEPAPINLGEEYWDQRLSEQKQLNTPGARAAISDAMAELQRLQPKGDEKQPDVAPAKPTTPPPVPQPEIASNKAKLDSLQAEVDKAKKVDIEQALKRRPYFQAKRDLESQELVRERLSLRIVSEKVDMSIPKLGIVKIVEQADAQPASSPTLGERIKGAFAGGVERSARIAVEKTGSTVAGLDFGHRAPTGFDPYWIQTEFETVQSKPILTKVIEELNLNEAWAEKPGSGQKLTIEETYKRLKKRLNVSQDPKTSLIDIRVRSEKPEEAARIANTIAKVYRDQRLAEQEQLRLEGIRTLQEELAKQNESIASAQRELKRLQPEDDGKQADPTPTKPTTPPPVPQPEIQTRDNAFSTFSLNVSDVSFKLAAASLEKGQMPEPATVRSEEFINAFDYRDPEPSPSAPIGFAWERARYPFAHNRDLLRFSVKTAAAGRQPGRPLNLVLLLDNSGSMERADRVRIIHEALRVLARQFQPQDKISLIAFARTARLWMDGVSGSQAGEVAEKASSLTPQGGTNLDDALNLAYQTAQRHYLAHGINRVVLLTDGAANLGNVQPEALKQKVEAHRKQGIALDCFGVGWEGFNDDLETLSRNGDGRYGFINTPDDAATEFAGQLAGALKVAASDVKVQVEFNPERVTAYRQIGYAKHQLTKEQFRDNTVDAAEIGAAESGNALYVVETNPRGKGPLATVRVRFKVPGTADYREHDWDVPYNGSAMALEQASVPMRLAATASAFSEWLVSSPYAAEVTPDRLLGYLGGVAEACGVDERPKKLEWMIRQAKGLYGK